MLLMVLIIGVIWYTFYNKRFYKLQGTTMGGIVYHVTFKASFEEEETAIVIDSLLHVINQTLSTYKEDSEISVFNKKQSVTFGNEHFYNVLKISEQAYALSEGFFDPTIGNLLNNWGFGSPISTPNNLNNSNNPTGPSSQSFCPHIGFHALRFNEKQLQSIAQEDTVDAHSIYIDFGGIAKGYAVDKVAEYLTQQGMEDYMVEIGGEIRCEGLNEQNVPWVIGLEKPAVDSLAAPEPMLLLQHTHYAMATSGNYRKYKTLQGKRYAHIMDPKKRMPMGEEYANISASIIAPNATLADALATACMVMGQSACQNMIEKHDFIEGIILYHVPANTPAEGTLSHTLDKSLDVALYVSEGLKDKINHAMYNTLPQ